MRTSHFAYAHDLSRKIGQAAFRQKRNKKAEDKLKLFLLTPLLWIIKNERIRKIC